MQNLDLQKELTFEEVKHFFSKCDEYEVSQYDEHGAFKITLKVTMSVDYIGVKPTYTYCSIATLVYEPTIQKLINAIEMLGYRAHLECHSLPIIDDKINTVDEIKLEPIYSGAYQDSKTIEDKLAILYKNQEKILQAIKLIANDLR
jgi:sporulation-control protein spo0M